MTTPRSPSDLLGLMAGALASGAVEVVDLTHTLAPDFPIIVLPPELGQCAPFRMEEISRYDERGPAWYWNNFTCGEHTGTHFDAPAHWISGKDLPDNTVDTIPPQQFLAPACVLDFSREAQADADFALTREHIMRWEEEHGRIPDRNWVFLRTDWSRKVGTPEYLNMREDGAHSPGPDPEAVRFLVEERDIIGFGTETVGTDSGQGFHFIPPYPAHFLMHGRGRYGLQCLTDLHRLPPRGSLIFSAPLKIRRGSGSPLRVLALIPGASL